MYGAIHLTVISIFVFSRRYVYGDIQFLFFYFFTSKFDEISNLNAQKTYVHNTYAIRCNRIRKSKYVMNLTTFVARLFVKCLIDMSFTKIVQFTKRIENSM